MVILLKHKISWKSDLDLGLPENDEEFEILVEYYRNKLLIMNWIPDCSLKYIDY